jgi:hypothetical protein
VAEFVRNESKADSILAHFGKFERPVPVFQMGFARTDRFQFKRLTPFVRFWHAACTRRGQIQEINAIRERCNAAEDAARLEDFPIAEQWKRGKEGCIQGRQMEGMEQV